MSYDPAEVDRFIELADAVEDAFPGVLVEGVEVRAWGPGETGGGKGADRPALLLRQEEQTIQPLALAPGARAGSIPRLRREPPRHTPADGDHPPSAPSAPRLQSDDGSAPFEVSLEGGEVVFARGEGQAIPGDDDLVAALSLAGLRPVS